MLLPRFSRIVVLAATLACLTTGCFTTLVRTDTLTSYELYSAPVAPPPVPSDAIVVAPEPAPAGATWEQPYWLWYGGAYTWMPGRYIPTLGPYVFHQPRWVARDGHWVFSGGVWTNAEGQIVASAPPQTAVGPTQGLTVGGFVASPTTCAPTSSMPSARTPTLAAADVAPEPAYRGRIDHTVTLGHLYYGTPHVAHDDAAPPSSPSPSPGTHADHGTPYGYGYGYGTVITGRMPMYGASRVYSAPSRPAPSAPPPPSAPMRSSAPAPSFGGTFSRPSFGPGPSHGGTSHGGSHGSTRAP